MNKKIIIISIIAVIILIVSIIILPNREKKHVEDKIITVNDIIDDKKIKIDYYDDVQIDEELSYGNIIKRTLKVTNQDSTPISVALKLDEASITNMNIEYDVSMATTLDGEYIILKSDAKLEDNYILQYNIGIEPKESIYIKVVLKDKHEVDNNKIKGKLKIITNLSDKDVFLKEVNNIYDNINKKIEGKNGISEAGYFILEVNSINSTIGGYVLLDTMDISNIKYIYTVYNNKYLLNKREFSKIEKKLVENMSDSIKPSITFDSVCSSYTKKACKSFDELGYNEKGTKTKFYNDVNRIVVKVKEDFKNKDKKVYIYDVVNDISNETDVRGYILINNLKDSPEYYLYLTNNVFMISGYNLSKYGDIVENGATIRAYNETSYNLSSDSISSVCGFTGFTECVNKNGDAI